MEFYLEGGKKKLPVQVDEYSCQRKQMAAVFVSTEVPLPGRKYN